MTISRTDLDRLHRLIASMLVRGTIDEIDDARMMQTIGVRLEDGYRPRQAEHWQPYGLSYHPQNGAEVIAVSLGGNRDHMIIMPGADRRYRLKNMEQGELAIHDDQGQKVHFKRDAVFVETDKKVVAKAPLMLVGDDDEGMPWVMTEAGPSSVLKAKV